MRAAARAPRPAGAQRTARPRAAGDEQPEGTAARPYTPLEVTAEMCGDGLGLTSWWDAAGGDDGAEAADGQE
jgi:hypothetical protein